MIERLKAIWVEYPVVTLYCDGTTEVTFESPNKYILTEKENSILAHIDEILSEYLNDKIMAGNGMRRWAAPCHQDIINISYLKWGVSPTYATCACNAADDPDSWPSIWSPLDLHG